jgi:hypothetical protein
MFANGSGFGDGQRFIACRSTYGFSSDQSGREREQFEHAPVPLVKCGAHGSFHNLAPVVGTLTSVDAASFGGGLRLGWLNAVTADLSVTQVAQGQGLVGTTALPGVLSAGPRRNTRFFFILSARL